MLNYINYLIQKKIIEKKYKHKILSNSVSLKSLNGKQIQIMGNTHVDGGEIGGYSYIGYNCSITKTIIGRYVSIANNVSIGMGEHKLNKISTNSLFYMNAKNELTEKECVIGNDVWIGVDSIIRRGVKIGNGAIIGANSFVNKNVPNYAIAVGSPAKVIRLRFTEEQQKKIEESKWWEHDLEQAKILLYDLEKNTKLNDNL